MIAQGRMERWGVPGHGLRFFEDDKNVVKVTS